MRKMTASLPQEGSSKSDHYQEVFEIPAGVAIIESDLHESFISDITIKFLQFDENPHGAVGFLLSMPAEDMKDLWWEVYEQANRIEREIENRKFRKEEKARLAANPTEKITPPPPPPPNPDDDIPF